MNNFYVYIYKNPLKDNTPFYVGKGKKRRAYDHLNETISNTHNYHKFWTINKIRQETGDDPIIEFYKTDLSNEEAIKIEEELITLYGREDLGTGILTNLSDGGEGNFGYKHTYEDIIRNRIAQIGKVRSEESKRRQSKNAKGLKRSEETKEKLRLANLGEKNNMFGKSLSEETRRKISQSLKGKSRVFTDEHREKLSLAKRGMKHSEEWKRQHSEKLKESHKRRKELQNVKQ